MWCVYESACVRVYVRVSVCGLEGVCVSVCMCDVLVRLCASVCVSASVNAHVCLSV